jgi:hypothetical protein
LTDGARNLLLDQGFDESRSGQNGRTERLGERAHVRVITPINIRRNQLQADFVFEDMWRCVRLYMQRSS